MTYETLGDLVEGSLDLVFDLKLRIWDLQVSNIVFDRLMY